MENKHTESHEKNTGWLRAGVLGANDGLLSTAGLLSGVIAGQANHDQILLAGVAALLSGALSMAAGEYVSVSSQRDSQKAQLRQEAHEIKKNPELEQLELCRIYMDRGLDETLARQVSFQLMQCDPLEAHAREELGLTEVGVAPSHLPVPDPFLLCASLLFPLLEIGFGFVKFENDRVIFHFQ